jgi:dihydropteroate synthase
MIYDIGNKKFDFSKKYFIMGILNITPDSFYDGGKNIKFDEAIKSAINMVNAGADIIDIGGESSRPGAEIVPEDKEINRVLPIIEKLKKEIDVPISIDTHKSGVADVCLKAGASILNDISGLTFDPEMIKTAAKYNPAVIINHIKGTPKTMQNNPNYENVISEIKQFFIERISYCNSSNLKKIIIDPGIGFGKNLAHNFQVFNNIMELKNLGYPLLIGPSRKRFIGEILNVEPENRLFGTAASIAISIYNGADIIRVHDVTEMKQVAEVSYRIRIGI